MTYKKKYLKYFGYGEQEFVPCEICGSGAVDVHHIDKNRKNNDITNLMGLCRECHNKAHSALVIMEQSYFQMIHNKFMAA